MSDDEHIIEGGLPENAVPVHSFMVGYGQVSAVDDDGVQALPMVTIMTNDGNGPMMLFSLDATVRLIGELGEAVPKSVAKFDPEYAKQVEKAEEVIARTQRAGMFHDRWYLFGYLATLGVIALIGVVGGNLVVTGNMLLYALALMGATYLLRMLAVEAAEWMNRRDRKKRRGE